MNKIILKSSFILLLAMLACRKDFVVENITNKTITVNAPANNLVTSSNTITFWWEPVDGAEKYNLQIVKPSFTSVAQLIADTSIAATKINVALQPGTYQWRIKATNAGHSTAFQTYNLKIDSSTILTNQLVIPISPLEGYKTKEKTVNFSWNVLATATSYSLELKLNNTVINNTTTTSSNYQYTFPVTSAANYTCSWRVKAINAGSISQYNTAQTFIIDMLPPAVSSPSLPVNNGVVKDTVDLVWRRLAGNDAKTDSLFIYTDSGFLNLLKKVSSANTKLKINQIDASNPLPLGTSSLNPIQYWWRVKSVDSLGNTSGFSSGLSFQVY